MEQKVRSYLDWVDSCVLNDVETDFSSTFCQSEKQSKLEILRFCQKNPETRQNGPEIDVSTEQVLSPADLEHYSQLRDSCQIFSVGQRNSYARLYITRRLFQELLYKYGVFDQIWEFVLPFSFKTRESDIGHAPFKFRQSEPLVLGPTCQLGSFECAYGFRYVELNHRKGNEDNKNPDYDPWSIRQTAVYQQYNSKLDRITFVLISPSKRAKKDLELAVRRCIEMQTPVNAFDLHRTIIGTLHVNWRHYLRSLDKLLMLQSDRVTLAQVQSETEKLSPLTGFAVNFIDRQRLKKIQDKILDLVIVFESLYHTLSEIQRQCKLHCISEHCKECSCSYTIEGLEEQMHEAQVNLKKSGVLHKRAQGTAHLLSDLLDYENAQIAHLNEKSLNGLVKETKDENSKMRILTERSSRDAAAVKILTVITLIYLPMTVVLNFFSTQLIKVDDGGRISIISQSWWFAVVAIPLTIATFLVWKLWLSHAMRRQERKEGFEGCESKAGESHPSKSFGPIFDRPRFPWRKTKNHPPFDLESRSMETFNSLDSGSAQEKSSDFGRNP